MIPSANSWRSRRTILTAFGATTIGVSGGCLSWVGDDSSVDSYISVLNRYPADVEIEVIVHDDSTDTRVVDEAGTIPPEERYRTEFTVHLEDAGGSADVRASVQNVDEEAEDSEATETAILQNGGEDLGFAGNIDESGSVSLTVDEA